MMKNKICVALGTIITILVITLTIDLISIKMTSIPLIILKEEDDVDKVYYGILYNTYDCSLNKKVTIKLKMTKYSCPLKTSNTYIIEDESKLINNFTCNEVLDEIYKDNDYSYNLTCEKASYIQVKYSDGLKINIKDALKNGKINIEDLKTYNIEYVKVPLNKDEQYLPTEPILPSEPTTPETPVIPITPDIPNSSTGNNEPDSASTPTIPTNPIEPSTPSSDKNDTVIVNPGIKKDNLKNPTTSAKSIEVIDKSTGKYCAEAIEYFYQNYYFSCIKSNYVYVKINGKEYLLKDALKNGIVTMKELEDAGYKFRKNNNMNFADR